VFSLTFSTPAAWIQEVASNAKDRNKSPLLKIAVEYNTQQLMTYPVELPMPTNQSFPYTALDPQRHQFRLLHIISANQPSNDIQCYLTVSSPLESDSYDALSYAWGDPSNTLPISINSHTLKITRNLEAALRQLRLSDKRVLWVDAVCINQAVPQEKSHQVSRMHEFYSNADKVIVWLGEASDRSDVALDLVKNAAAVARKATGVELDIVFDLATAPPSENDRELWRKSVMKGWKSLALLFMRSWWRRAWVVQEVAFSRSCIVLCGSREIDWKDFVDSWLLIWNTSQNLRVPFTTSLYRMRIVQQMHSFWVVTRSSSVGAGDGMLIHLLTASRSLEATDPRDHVFSCLNIGYFGRPFGPFPSLEVNYEKDAA
jgi:hypothetical protein